MFNVGVISFREGLEMFLIVAISAMYLRQTGRAALLGPLRLGVGTAVAFSIVLGLFLAKAGGMTPIWEAWLAVAAAVMVISCTVHMLRHGKQMKREITGALDRAALGRTAAFAVFGFMLLMVGREGVETATMLAAMSMDASYHDMFIGGLAGVSLASAIAWAWARFGHKVNLSRFFTATSIFMVLFSIQLVIYAFHEFSEAGVLPLVDNSYWHAVSEPYGPEGRYGTWLTFGLMLIPLGFLGAAWLRDRVNTAPATRTTA